MPSQSGGLLALATLGGFALAVALVVGIVTSGGGSVSSVTDDAGGSGPSDSAVDAAGAAAADAVFVAGGGDPSCAKVADGYGRSEFDELGPIELAAIVERCLPPGVTVQVLGLPGVSGWYSTSLGNLGVTGLAIDDQGFGEGSGCFVSESGMFQTKVWQLGVLEERGFPVQITVDVGVTGSGQPFATVVREVADTRGESQNPLAAMFVTHVYEPSAWGPDGQDYAEAKWWARSFPEGVSDNPWAGIATFSSESYNQREYLPYADDPWEGTPLYEYTIQVWCR